jgi:hypothetical protein
LRSAGKTDGLLVGNQQAPVDLFVRLLPGVVRDAGIRNAGAWRRPLRWPRRRVQIVDGRAIVRPSRIHAGIANKIAIAVSGVGYAILRECRTAAGNETKNRERYFHMTSFYLLRLS